MAITATMTILFMMPPGDGRKPSQLQNPAQFVTLLSGAGSELYNLLPRTIRQAMIQLPYIEPVFRPPSEARSLILQVTNGCSWNRCTFCEMYTQPQKQFRLKPQARIEQELEA